MNSGRRYYTADMELAQEVKRAVLALWREIKALEQQSTADD